MNGPACPDLITLQDGTPATLRPIFPQDGPSLQRGLERLSPESNAYRFLHHRSRFTEADLHYLTNCDFWNHLAAILAIRDGTGREVDQVGVARSIRDKRDPELAEVAIVLVDAWQRRGGGRALLGYLARLAWDTGIRFWQAYSFVDNQASRRLLATAGQEISRRPFGSGVVETRYRLNPPCQPSQQGKS